MDDSLEYEPEYEPKSEYEPEYEPEFEQTSSKRTEPPPLPRLWKDPADSKPAVETSPSPQKKKRAGDESVPRAQPYKPKPKKKKKVEEVVDDGTGATKLAETPVLDTYETRQRVRWLIGGVLTVIMVCGIFFGLKAFKGGGSEEITEAEPPAESRVNSEAKAGDERQARTILDMAKDADKIGKTSAALVQLKKVTKNYPGTTAAREAADALERNKQDRPLFGVDLLEQSSGPKPPPGTAIATGPVAPRNGATAGTSKAPGAPVFATAPSPPSATALTSLSPGNVSIPPPPIVSKPIPTGYRPMFSYPIHSSGWPTRIVCDRDGAEMVLVPAATFLMGRGDGEPQEGPTHEVSVSTFYIDLHEVTVRQYLNFLKESGRPIDVAKLSVNGNPVPEDQPIVNVTARDAREYCVSMKRRLPTEAQWELAARGQDRRISYWNGELPRKDPVKGVRPMESVMSLPSDVSPYGVFDLAANAWEWTSEYYDSKYYLQFRNPVVDPTGPKESPARVARATVKGGSDRGYLTWRTGLNLESKLPYLGFRGALPVEGAPVAPVAAPSPIVGPGRSGGVQPF